MFSGSLPAQTAVQRHSFRENVYVPGITKVPKLYPKRRCVFYKPFLTAKRDESVAVYRG
jgi:tRNA G26 N,N-dimethylase Trm1